MGDRVNAGPTEREIQVLLAIAEHGSSAAAAEVFGISDQSAKNATQRLRNKLGVTSNLSAYHRLMKGARAVITRTTETEIRMETVDE
jgi:DNA-binding CsgD family transcriptional regulator